MYSPAKAISESIHARVLLFAACQACHELDLGIVLYAVSTDGKVRWDQSFDPGSVFGNIDIRAYEIMPRIVSIGHLEAMFMHV